MDKRRADFEPVQSNSFQKRSRHHLNWNPPYRNQRLPFQSVYKRHTTKAESESSGRQFHNSGWRRKEHNLPVHRPKTKKHDPYMQLESSSLNSGRHVPESRRRKKNDIQQYMKDIKQEPSARTGDNFDLKTHVLKMIVADLQTPRLVEEEGFQHFIKSLNPSTDAALSASVIRQGLENMYTDTKKKVKDAVRNAKDPVLSAEVWTSSNEESYLTVTCHFIDKKWELKSYTLDTAQLLGEHTPENVHLQLCRISKDWEIMEKIKVVVVNIDGMKKSNPKSIWFYIPCFSYTLNKVIREVLTDNPDWRCLLKKCRHVVQFFYQEHEALWCHRLAQSSCVDWLQTLNMVKKICEQWQSFSRMPSYKHKTDLWFNENERKLLENMVKVLTVVKDTIVPIGTNGYFSVSNIIPLVDNLQLSLQMLIQQENKVASALSERCKFHFENINQNDWFTVSTALDPRYKRSVLMSGGGGKVIARIKEEMRSGCHINVIGDDEELIQRYLTEGNIPVNQSPLQYWAAKDKDFATVAHKFLSVISTAIPIDQMMHEDQSRIMFNRRKCLELKDINMILFLNGNQQRI